MNVYEKSDQLLEDEFRSTSICSPHKIIQISIAEDDIFKAPLSDILLKSLKAVDWICMKFLINREASLRVSYPLFLLGFQEDFEHIHHAAGIKDCTVLGKKFSRDRRQFLLCFFPGAASGLGFAEYLAH